jgi:hypothetical protein
MKNALLLLLVLATVAGFAQTTEADNLRKLLDHPLVKALDKSIAAYTPTFTGNGIIVKTNDVQKSNVNTYYVAKFPMTGDEGPMDKIYQVYWSYFDTSKVYKFVPNTEVVPAMDLPVAVKWGMGVNDYLTVFGKPDTIHTYDSYSYSNLYAYHYFTDSRNPHIKQYYVVGVFYTKSHPVGEKVKDPVYLLRELHIGVKEWDVAYFDPKKATRYYPNPSNWQLEPHPPRE